jgi:hypothetical protein
VIDPTNAGATRDGTVIYDGGAPRTILRASQGFNLNNTGGTIVAGVRL